MKRVVYIGRTMGKTHVQKLIDELSDETICIVPENGVIDLKEALKHQIPRQVNLFSKPKPKYYGRKRLPKP